MATAFLDTEVNSFGQDKIKRYGWKADDEPGDLRYVSKHQIHVDESYQRDANHDLALRLAAKWSYMSCGAITVARRLDGSLWAVDGQHRVLASKKRSDIKDLPCVIFNCESVEDEAKAFLDLNTGKPVSAIAKHRAAVMAKDPVALLVQDSFEGLGLRLVRSAKTVSDITCVAWCNKKAAENLEAYLIVLAITLEISRADGLPVHEKLLDGLYYVHLNVRDGLGDRKLNKRIREVGAHRLSVSIQKACAYYARGGAKVFAQGIIEELNKNLRHKFTFACDA